jgi:hypothetical protein
MHFLQQSVAVAGGHHKGKFKNSAGGRASLIPIVRTMRPAGKGVTEAAQESCRNNRTSHRLFSTRILK